MNRRPATVLKAAPVAVRKRRTGNRPPTLRAALTNGTRLLLGAVDPQTPHSRRFADLIEIYTDSLGGPDVVTPAQASLVRRAAALQTECEARESQFLVAGGATDEEADTYARLSAMLLRMLTRLGLVQTTARGCPLPARTGTKARTGANGSRPRGGRYSEFLDVLDEELAQ